MPCRFLGMVILHLVVMISSTACAPMVIAQSAGVTSPEEHLGRPVGVDFELADWTEESSYFRLLGEQSPHVITKRVGETTEGRDFLISIISSESNLANLESIKSSSRILADPRGSTNSEVQDAIQNGKVILFVSCAMHATEAAGSQFGLEFAYTLATSNEEPWKSARDSMVVVLYVTNPDGVDHVTNWYRETVGTPYEATGLLKLYQYYAGHDNNRDWFMLTQNETRIVSELLYTEWFPQIYWDVHQQGSSRERFFVPPYRDPLNPNLDPNIITGIDALGSRALHDLTRAGFKGVSTGVSYDMWWNGGNRNVPVRHNIIGLLTEAASVNIASPKFFAPGDLAAPRGIEGGYISSNRFPDPWPGGWWRLRDIIDYEMEFGQSLLASVNREPATWRSNAHQAASRTIRAGRESAPIAWIMPSDNRDPDAVRRFIDVLLRTGVEVHVSPDAIEADGRTYPAGSIVIMRDQPYGQHIKDLMDVQRYPDGAPPYDVSGWTLPFLLGIRRVEVVQPFAETPFVEVQTPAEATELFAGDVRVIDPKGMIANRRPWSVHHSSAWQELVQRLQTDSTVQFAKSGPNEGVFLSGEFSLQSDMLTEVSEMPRIGIYSPWSGSMDEGWLRYVFDTNDVPYDSIKNEMIRAGQLNDVIDVLIVASIGSSQLNNGRSPGTVPDRYASGLSPEGAIAIEDFVRNGGRLITLGSSSQWAIDLLELPITDVTRGAEASGFSCPGSVLRALPKTESAYVAGLPGSLALFFSRSAAYRTMSSAEVEGAYGIGPRDIAGSSADVDTLLRYAPTRVLMSGWLKESQVIENQAAWMYTRYGQGDVHIFGFRPQYRGWSQATFPLIFRAVFLDES